MSTTAATAVSTLCAAILTLGACSDDSEAQARRIADLEARVAFLQELVQRIPAGPQGPQGERGDTGQAGVPGIQGPPGHDGLDGFQFNLVERATRNVLGTFVGSFDAATGQPDGWAYVHALRGRVNFTRTKPVFYATTDCSGSPIGIEAGGNGTDLYWITPRGTVVQATGAEKAGKHQSIMLWDGKNGARCVAATGLSVYGFTEVAGVRMTLYPAADLDVSAR